MNTIWEDAQIRLRHAGQLAGLDREVIELLSEPKRVLMVRIPVKKDNDGIEIISAYRVCHNDALGPTIGGIRMARNLKLDDVKALALLMTIKFAVAGLRAGGGKGGIVVSPKELSERELEQLCRAYTRYMDAKGPWADVFGADLGTTHQMLAWMMDEYEQIAGVHSPAVAIDKPTILGGTLGIEDTVAQGLWYLVREIVRTESLVPQSSRIAIQGFGDVGRNAAKLLHSDGFRIIAVGDTGGAIFDSAGLDIPAVLKAKEERGSVVHLPGANIIGSQELLELECEILIPCAVENVIDDENATRVKTKLILEGANAPITTSADRTLQSKGIVVVPGVVANAGGILVNQAERTQGLCDRYWDLGAVHEHLKQAILQAYRETRDTAEEMGVSLRDAAWVNALRKVGAAVHWRGWV